MLNHKIIFESNLSTIYTNHKKIFELKFFFRIFHQLGITIQNQHNSSSTNILKYTFFRPLGTFAAYLVSRPTLLGELLRHVLVYADGIVERGNLHGPRDEL